MEASAQQRRQARFWRKLLRLTRGRVTVMRAVEVILAEETEDGFRGALEALQVSLREGHTLSEAMVRQDGVFSLSVVELVRTAECTGAWDEIVQEIADGLEEGTFS